MGNARRFIELLQRGFTVSGGADNLTLNAGSGGATLATDDVAGVHHQKVKVEFGGDDAATQVTASVGLPTDPLDRAARDLGKVDVASLDQYTPEDVDSGGGTVNALPVTLKVSGAGGVNITGDAANGLDVDVTRLPALAAGTANIGDVDVATIAAGDNNIGNVDIVTVPADPFGANADAVVAAGAAGSIQAKLRRVTQGLEDLKTLIVLAAGANRIGKVTVRNAADAADIDPLAEGTFTGRLGEVQASPTANTVLARLKDLLTGIVLAAGTAIIGKVGIDQTSDGTTNKVAATQATAANLNAQVVGSIAHDGADSGNPLKIGAKAIAYGAAPTAVAANDRTDLYANRHGIPFSIGGHPNIVTVRANYTTAQTDAAIVTQGAGGKIAVTQLMITASAGNSVNPSAIVGFGAANTPTTTGVVGAHPGIPPGGGFSRGDGSAVIGIGADGDDLRITSGVPTGGSIDVVVSYFVIDS